VGRLASAFERLDGETGFLWPRGRSARSARGLLDGGETISGRASQNLVWEGSMYRPCDQALRDLRFGVRQFRRAPGLTLAAVLALTCGIGATVTVFTLVDTVLLRPLPVPAPDELVSLRDPSFSYPMFEQIRDRGHMLNGVFAWHERALHAAWTDEAEPTSMLLVTGGFYDTLGLRPETGRLLNQADVGNTPAEAQAVAVLSYAAWQQRFTGDPTVIGRTLRIEGQPFTIIGVTPRGFFGVAVGMSPDVTIPVTMLPRLRSDESDALVNAGSIWLQIMGRVRPGLSIAQADAAFQPVWTQALVATASSDWRPAWRARYLKFTSGLDPGASGYSPVRRQFQDALWLLFGLVALVLIIACATVANLLLAAAAGRRRELALRLAIGAGRARLVQQLLLEGLLLAGVGGALGCLFASWAADLLVRLLSTSYGPVTMTLGVDGRVLAFTAGAIGIAAIAFTLAPIVRAVRIDPGPVLKAGAHQGGGVRRPAGIARAMVAAQVALSMVLLVGSALFVRNLTRLLMKDPGFDREGLLVVSVDVLSPVSARSAAGDRAPDLTVWYGELLRRLRETPGVRAASLSRKPPISNELGYWFDSFIVEGQPAPTTWPSTDRGRTFLNAVSPGYFATVGTPFLAGRDFSPGDTEGRLPVAVINASMAAAYFGSENPIGQRLRMGDGKESRSVEVIGVVRDSVYHLLQEEPRRIVYVPYMQVPKVLEGANLYAEVRSAGGGLSGEALRAAVRELDATAPLRIETVRHRIDESLVQERLVTVIATFLGGVSLLLACGALGGLLSHMVASRTSEIGLRIALGADRRAVTSLVMREALGLTAAGAFVGVGLALAGGRLVASFLYDLTPTDPVAVGVAASLMLLTAAVTGYLPARRAARVDPIEALRAE
jgi:predicted permease